MIVVFADVAASIERLRPLVRAGPPVENLRLGATMRAGTIRVAIAGANDIVAEGLRSLLASEADVEVLEVPCASRLADVIVYDVIGLDADGGTEFRRMTAGSKTPVLAVGRDLRPDLASRAMTYGAAGSFSLEADRVSVLAMVRAAATGELDDDARRSLGVLGADVGLTQREVDVLAGIARGLSNDDIGQLLNLTNNTVKSYIRSAYSKIGVTTRTQAVAWCLRHGFEPPS